MHIMSAHLTADFRNCRLQQLFLLSCRYDLMVDIAGGNGQLLAQLLSKHSSLQGVLVEQQEQVERGKKVTLQQLFCLL
jgi:hypothetical protein